MNILYLAKAYPPETGGVETYSEQVAMAYARAGHRVTVVTAHPGPTGKTQRGDVIVHNVGQEGGQARVFTRMLAKLWSMKREAFDLVHATTWRVALPALVLRRKLPMVITMHGREVFVVPRPLRPLMRAALTHAKHLPTISQAIEDKIRKDIWFDISGAFVCWNGISFAEESLEIAPKPDKIGIYCMCRLVARKNLAGAIRAVARLVREGHNITFKIAGSGEEEDALRALVQELDAGHAIELLGRVPDADVLTHYRNSHIFLHPQITTRGGQDIEGFGLTIADAMSFGCVPVAGASGGPLDFIRSGETGYLVDGTKEDEIVTALKKLITDRTHLDTLGQAAHAFAHDTLTWDAHARKIIDAVVRS